MVGSTATDRTESFSYNDAIVRSFVLATVVWGVVGLLLGVFVALQLADWKLNFGIPWLTFGRLRPLHTNAAIFAFAGNAIFAGIYHSSQRLLKTRLFSDALAKFHFWGWQLIIVAAALTIPLGYTVSKEYAELECPIDIAVAVVWVIFAVNFIMTLKRRRESHMYVALWFYIATIITVAVLHIVNSINIPVSFLKSYPIYTGVQDALIQWWYGHNAVAFFLTTPFLGLMYYYVPKAASRPVYSYRLSIIHFWSLVFIYIWAGPHHLLYTALPEWAQTLGMLFSVMLWAPSWGGMVNGLLTLRGAWDRVRSEPILKFFAAALTFYGMATFEGPLLSIKSVNSIAHYTDWIIGHVHGGTLGWNGFMVAGMLYYLVPRLWKTELYSKQLANIHFWTGFFGIVLYIASMWVAGITQSLMLRATTDSGALLYPDFAETLVRIIPLYWVRALGGGLYLIGYLLMVFNIIKTICASKKENLQDEQASAPALALSTRQILADKPHRWVEAMPMVFTILSLVAILVGTIVELIPSLLAQKYVEAPSNVKPYTPLQVAGRDLYVREGCYVCHSQMVRPLKEEFLRYGPASEPYESMYDTPFQWGSRRTGPDLARVGGKYPDLWHLRHFLNPRDVVPQSIMPNYAWFLTRPIDFDSLPKKLRVLKMIGIPYSDDEIRASKEVAEQEAKSIADNLRLQGGPEGLEDKEVVAIISYLQHLGTMISSKKGTQ